MSNLPDVVLVLSFALVGAIVTIKRPGNLVGWTLSLAGVGLLVGGVLGAYAELALLAKPEAGLPGGAAAAAISAGSWTPLMAGVFPPPPALPAWPRALAALAPRGRARRWAPSRSSGCSSRPHRVSSTSPFEAFENPLAFTGSKGYLARPRPDHRLLPRLRRRSRRSACCQVPPLARGGAPAVQVVGRQRRAAAPGLAVRRGQLQLSRGSPAPYSGSRSSRCPSRSASRSCATASTRSTGSSTARSSTASHAAPRRASTSASSSALQQIFSGFTGGSDLAIAGSTLAVAALFRPVRRCDPDASSTGASTARRYDAQRTLEAFSARLRDEVDLETLGTELAAVVHDDDAAGRTSRSGCAGPRTSHERPDRLGALRAFRRPRGSRARALGAHTLARGRIGPRARPTLRSSSPSSPTRPSAP